MELIDLSPTTRCENCGTDLMRAAEVVAAVAPGRRFWVESSPDDWIVHTPERCRTARRTP